MIVHCGDVRDMIGHYPPVCYPANGWKPGPSAPTGIQVNQEDATAYRYEFSRNDELFDAA